MGLQSQSVLETLYHKTVHGELSAATYLLIFSSAILFITGTHFLRLLYFHPLSSFPGPKLAALTIFYQAYYEVYKDGKWVHHLWVLHDKYGPIVRVGPNHLHFSDPNVYHTLYTNSPSGAGSKLVLKKDPMLYHAWGFDESSPATTDPAVSRKRRAMILPFFQKRNILSESMGAGPNGVIGDKVAKLCRGFERCCGKEGGGGAGGERRPANLSLGIRCFSLDVITEFCFGTCFDALDAPGFEFPFIVLSDQIAPVFALLKYVRILKWVALNCPPWLTLRLNPQLAPLVMVQQVTAKQTDELLASPWKLKEAKHPTIWNRLMVGYEGIERPEAKGEEEWEEDGGGAFVRLTRRELFDEAQGLILAGSDTVGGTVSNGTLLVLKNPHVYQRLVEELLEAWPVLEDVPPYETLEKLPYLTAVIKESLRLAYGVAAPLPRILPRQGMVIAGKHIPGGTVVGITSYFLHRNPDLFTDPLSFNPSRWLQGASSRELESKWLVPFSRGPRQCLGLNLGWVEMYLTFANLFRRFEMELYDTSEDGVEFKAFFTTVPVKGNIKAFVKKRA